MELIQLAPYLICNSFFVLVPYPDLEFTYGMDSEMATKTSEDRFNELKQFAEDNGFELLETKWLGIMVKHLFLHKESNKEYEGRPNDILRDGFPKDLRSNEDRFNELKQFAEDNGFELLDSKWLGTENKHRFLHKASNKEYEWRSDQVLRNGFPKDLRSNEDRFNELKRLAEDNGFELLEIKWLGSNKKHRFLHKATGEIYEQSPSKLLARGFNLLEGQRFLTQEVCRQAFAHIFGGEFKTNRDRLRDIHGSGMELDGYEEFERVPDAFENGSDYFSGDGSEIAFIIHIAFEFQGHQSHRERQETIERDKLKYQYCEQEGILLVQIEPPVDKKQYSEFWRRIRDSEFMYAYICRSIQQAAGAHAKISFPPGFKIDLVNWNPDKEAYLNLKQFAEDNGFELLDSKWLGTENKHRFLHKASNKEYEWRPAQVLHNGFPISRGLVTDLDRFNELKQLAEDSGFELLETKWLGANNKHRFLHKESGEKREWISSQVLSRGFPKDVRSNEDRFNELKRLAEDNGFELLEIKWLGNDKKHRFIHKETGKEYEWIPSQVLFSGFPKDLRTNEDKFNSLKQIAEDSGFELLETKWLGSRVKHRFLHKESGKESKWKPQQVLYQGFPKDLRTNEDHFNNLKQLAEENGFELLETKWLGANKKHRFLHKESGKEYEWRPNNILGKGFPNRLQEKPSLPAISLQPKLVAAKSRAAELMSQMPPYPGDEAMMDPTPTPPAATPTMVAPAAVAKLDEPSGVPLPEIDDQPEPEAEVVRPRLRA
jgi:uncharacterized protein with GYD domain